MSFFGSSNKVGIEPDDGEFDESSIVPSPVPPTIEPLKIADAEDFIISASEQLTKKAASLLGISTSPVNPSDENALIGAKLGDISQLEPDDSIFVNLNDADIDEKNAATRIRELLVSKQQKEHLSPSSVFNLIYNDKLHLLLKELKKNPDLIKDGDAVGANPVHVAYLYKKYEIGRWIVSNYPDESLLPYSTRSTFRELPERFMPYYGENILHMCIIRRDHTEVRFLLDFYRERLKSVPSVERRLRALKQNKEKFESLKKFSASESFVDYTQTGLTILLSAKAKGTFFAIDGNFYCGETPLHFAVCCGDTDMFDMVFAYASSERPNALFGRDSHGNTLLHLCVMHNLTDMYKHVLGHAHARIWNQVSIACVDATTRSKGSTTLHLPVVEPIYSTEPSSPNFCPGFDSDVAFDGSVPRESALHIPPNGTFDEAYIMQATNQKLAERMLLVLNKDLHSPLTFAASLGNSKMFEFLVNQLKVPRWKYGPVSVSLIDLNGMDVPHNVNRYGLGLNRGNKSYSRTLPSTLGESNILGKPRGMKVCGAIEWLCIHYSTGKAGEGKSHLESFSIPFIKDIIDAKWSRSARYVFERDAIIAFMIAFLLTLISCLINYEPRFGNDASNGSVVLAVLYPVLFFFLLGLVLKELPQVIRFRLDYWGWYGGIRGAAVYEKLCMTALMLSFYSLCLLEVVKNRDYDTDDANGIEILADVGIETCLAICVISAWSYLFYSFMGFYAT